MNCGSPITMATGISLLRGAISDISSHGLPAEFLRGILEDLESLDKPPLSERSSALEQVGETRNFKDAVLSSLSNHGNVAQFVSFSPNLDIRYSRIVGHPSNATFTSPQEAIAHLLKASS